MKIHFIRHSEAIDHSVDGPDAHRYLTCRGRTRFRRVAASLKKMGIDPDIIITSPLIRAVQTADILAELLRFSGELSITPALAPGFNLSNLKDLLLSHNDAGEIVMVGHEPDLGNLVQMLLGISYSCNLRKGAVVSVEIHRKQPEQEPEFLGYVTGGGKVILNQHKALERLKAQ